MDLQWDSGENNSSGIDFEDYDSIED